MKRSSACISLVLFIAQNLTAQAWLPPKGSGYVSFVYQNSFARNHLLGNGGQSDRGPMRAMIMGVSTAYGFTDRFTLTADIPFIATQFNLTQGLVPSAHDREAKRDDGLYHGAFQDLRTALRYNAVRDPFSFTPFFELVLPSHRYETFGHAAHGRYLREYRMGFNLGRLLDPVLPKAFFDLRYAYSLAEKLAGIRPNRSSVDLDVGYSLTRSLSAQASGGWLRSHDGVEIPVAATSPLFQFHDRLERTHYARAGGSLSYYLGRNMDLSAGFFKTLSGKNTHDISVISVGVTWSFSRESAKSALHRPGAVAASRHLAGMAGSGF